MEWYLVLMAGITWAGPGVKQSVPYPDKASCYEALAAMQIHGTQQRAGEDDEQVVAYCKPKETRHD